jgi:WhiB family redox-sensing transcriptional regulator
MDQALCAQTDPALFHAHGGDAYQQARKICMACPVRAACEEYADHVEEGLPAKYRHGTWAGRGANTRYARTKDRTPAMSERDAAILRLSAGDLTDGEIAEHVGCTSRTVLRVRARNGVSRKAAA